MTTIKHLGNTVQIADALDDDKQLLLLVGDSEGRKIDAFLSIGEAQALSDHIRRLVETAPRPGAWTGWPVLLTEALTTDEGIVLPAEWRGHCVGDPGDEYIDVRFRMSNGPDITFKELDRSAFRVWGVS